MELTPEFMLSALAGAMLGLGAIGKYVQAKNKTDHQAPPAVLAVDRDHADRMSRSLESIASSLDTLATSVKEIADKRQSDMQHTLHEIAKHMAGR